MLHILIYKANVMSEIYPEDSAKSCSKLNIRIDDPTLIMPVHRSLTVPAKKKVWTTTTVRNHVKRQILDNKNYFSSKLFLFFHTRFWFEAEFYFFPFLQGFFSHACSFSSEPRSQRSQKSQISNYLKKSWKENLKTKNWMKWWRKIWINEDAGQGSMDWSVQSDQNMMKLQLSGIPMNSCEFFIWGFIIFWSERKILSQNFWPIRNLFCWSSVDPRCRPWNHHYHDF